MPARNNPNAVSLSRGARGAEGARQEEVVAVTPWPGAQTSCWRGPENRRYATVVLPTRFGKSIIYTILPILFLNILTTQQT